MSRLSHEASRFGSVAIAERGGTDVGSMRSIPGGGR
jgi:hypothetical protein